MRVHDCGREPDLLRACNMPWGKTPGLAAADAFTTAIRAAMKSAGNPGPRISTSRWGGCGFWHAIISIRKNRRAEGKNALLAAASPRQDFKACRDRRRRHRCAQCHGT